MSAKCGGRFEAAVSRGLPDILEILAQFLDGLHLLEEHGPGVLVRAPEGVGLGQQLPVAHACERECGLGDVVGCGHGPHTEKARQG